MKTLLFILFVMIFELNAYGQNQESKKLFTLDGNDIGGYIGVNGRVTTVNSLAAGLIDIRIAVVINNNWAFGYNTTGLWNDRHLNKLVTDGVYHLMGSYQGVFIERILSINENLRYSISLLVGQGIVKYEYCRSSIADRKWYEEIIDQADYNLIEPTIEINYNILDKFWLGVNLGYNLTTTIRMMDTESDLLNSINGGLSIKYGLF
jgi:hypothetical protein